MSFIDDQIKLNRSFFSKRAKGMNKTFLAFNKSLLQRQKDLIKSKNFIPQRNKQESLTGFMTKKGAFELQQEDIVDSLIRDHRQRNKNKKRATLQPINFIQKKKQKSSQRKGNPSLKAYRKHQRKSRKEKMLRDKHGFLKDELMGERLIWEKPYHGAGNKTYIVKDSLIRKNPRSYSFGKQARKTIFSVANEEEQGMDHGRESSARRLDGRRYLRRSRLSSDWRGGAGADLIEDSGRRKRSRRLTESLELIKSRRPPKRRGRRNFLVRGGPRSGLSESQQFTRSRARGIWLKGQNIASSLREIPDDTKNEDLEGSGDNEERGFFSGVRGSDSLKISPNPPRKDFLGLGRKLNLLKGPSSVKYHALN